MALKVRTTNGWEDVNTGTQVYWNGDWWGVRYLFEAIGTVGGVTQYRVHAFEPPYGIPMKPVLDEIRTPPDQLFPPPRIDAEITIGAMPPEVISSTWTREVWYTFTIPGKEPERVLGRHITDGSITKYIEPASEFQARFADSTGQRVAGKLTVNVRYRNERGWGRWSDDSNEIEVDSGP